VKAVCFSKKNSNLKYTIMNQQSACFPHLHEDRSWETILSRNVWSAIMEKPIGVDAHWSHNNERNTLVKPEKNKRGMKKIRATAGREKGKIKEEIQTRATR
jgi:hypothetical protein